ncbi:hypothetical protein G4G31_19395 [Massilia sp. Se16.2.3]|nr:hypothetical protein G4G31_19395 [Massilia sp. Se16.2.3]
MFGRGQRSFLLLPHAFQAGRQLGGIQPGRFQAAQRRQAVDHGALQLHLRFQAGAEPGAHGGESLGQLRRLDDRPFTVEVGDLVRRQVRVAFECLRAVEHGLATGELGVVVAQGIEPCLGQLGDAAVEVAHGRVHAFERFAAVQVLGRGQAQLGKIGVQDEFDSAHFVAAERLELFGLLLALAGVRGGTGGTGAGAG